jgi:hypothetical protein
MLNARINNEDENERLVRMLMDSLSGIEKKRIIERITGTVVRNNDNLIQIDKESQLDRDGGIRQVDTFNLKVFACGCKSDGRGNWGGVDYRGNITCAKHFYRCIRCRRPLSSLTVKPIKGIAYCARCRRVVRFLRFFGLKKK